MNNMKRINLKEKRLVEHSRGLAQLFSLANKYPVLNKEAEQTATEEQLINHNLLFVISVAKKYQHQGAELLDLIQEGRIGLIKAARCFDSSFGFRFTSFAVAKIRSEIIRYIESKRDLIRVPDILHRLSWKLEQSQLENESIEDTAERIGISKVYLKNHIEKKKVVSFDSQDSDGETYIEVAGDIFADSLVSKKDTKDIIEIAIKKLPERMQTIIRMRFFSDVNNTLDDVSEKLQVSRERVRQIESSALKMLKFHLSK